jgi:hypothetical protein
VYFCSFSNGINSVSRVEDILYGLNDTGTYTNKETAPDCGRLSHIKTINWLRNSFRTPA